MNASEEKIERVPCNACGQDTNHRRVAEHSQMNGPQDDEGEFIVYESTTYELFECCGCEEVKMRRTSFFSEGLPRERDVSLFPPPTERRMPNWLDALPPGQSELMSEVYSALQAGSRRLAAMGARTLIDMVMLDRVGDAGTFKSKLDALVDSGFLGSVDRSVLDAALEAGNAAVHRGHQPDVEELDTIMDIVEGLLHSTTLVERAKKLRAGTPKRRS